MSSSGKSTVLLDIVASNHASEAIKSVSADMDEGAIKAKIYKDSMAEAGTEAEAGLAKGAEGASKLESDLGSHLSGAESEAKGFTSRLGGLFSSLGGKMGNMGLPFAESVSKMGESMAEGEKQSGSFMHQISGVSNIVGGAVVAGFGAAAAEGIHLAEAYQQTTATIAANSGISVGAAKKITDAFLNTAGTSTMSAQEISSAFAPVAGEFVTLTGHALNSGQAMTVMKAAMDGAEASGEPLSAVTKTLADTMLVYHMKISDAASATNTMFNASRLMGVGMTSFGSSLARIEPRIVGSGMNLQQTSGFMLELAKSAGSGRQAMRLAGQGIQSLMAPSTAAQTALQQMGISLTDANGKFIGMPAALQKLHDAFAHMPGDAQAVAAGQQLMADKTELATLKAEPQTAATKAQEKAINSQIPLLTQQSKALSQSSAMQALFGRQANIMANLVSGGAKAFDKATAAVSRQGEAEKAAKEHADTLKGQTEMLKATFEDLTTKLGVALIPVLTGVMHAFMSVVNIVMHCKPLLVALGVVVGGMVAVAMVNLATSVGTKLVGSITKAGGSITSLLQKLGLMKTSSAEAATSQKTLATASETSATEQVAAQDSIQVAEEETAAVSEETGTAMAGAMGPVGLAIGAIIAVIMLLVTHWKEVEKVAKEVWKAIMLAVKTVWDWIKKNWPLLLAILTGPIGLAVLFIIKHWTQVKQFLQEIFTWLKKAWTDTVNGVISVAKDILDWFTSLPGKIMSAISGLLGSIASFFSGLVSNAISTLEKIIQWFISLPGRIVSALAGMAGKFLSMAGHWVSSILSGFAGIGGKIMHKITSGLGSLAGSIGGIIGLAEGGIVTKPTLAVIGEAGYPEAVVPLKNGVTASKNGVSNLPSGHSGGGPAGSTHGTGSGAVQAATNALEALAKAATSVVTAFTSLTAQIQKHLTATTSLHKTTVAATKTIATVHSGVIHKLTTTATHSATSAKPSKALVAAQRAEATATKKEIADFAKAEKAAQAAKVAQDKALIAAQAVSAAQIIAANASKLAMQAQNEHAKNAKALQAKAVQDQRAVATEVKKAEAAAHTEALAQQKAQVAEATASAAHVAALKAQQTVTVATNTATHTATKAVATHTAAVSKATKASTIHTTATTKHTTATTKATTIQTTQTQALTQATSALEAFSKMLQATTNTMLGLLHATAQVFMSATSASTALATIPTAINHINSGGNSTNIHIHLEGSQVMSDGEQMKFAQMIGKHLVGALSPAGVVIHH